VFEILPGFVEIALLIFCLIDCIQSDPNLIRNLPKLAWIVLIVVIPLVGGIAWLLVGRPLPGAKPTTVPWRSTQTAGFPEYERPALSSDLDEVDERLRRDQARVDQEHEDALRRWEASLRERERKLRPPEPPSDPAG
jgi:hypothetical protein